MSKQSIFPRVCQRVLRGAQRPRPFSCVVTVRPAELLNPQGRNNRSLQQKQQDAWSRRNPDPSGQIHLTAPSVRWFSDDKDDGEGTKNKKKDKKKQKKDEDKDEKPADKEGESKSDKKEGKSAATEIESKSEEAADDKPKKEKSDDEEDDECPTWQNPLHHNNPDNEKIFSEDFPEGEMPIAESPPMGDPNNPDQILASQELYDLADEVVLLSMLEMKELVNKIRDHFGFEEPPFTGPGSGAGGGDAEEDGGDEAAAAEARTAFDLKLTGFDAKSKIKVIKEVRAIAGLGLKEAKEMVEGAPKVVMKDINKEMAEELKEKLEAVGAEIEIV